MPQTRVQVFHEGKFIAPVHRTVFLHCLSGRRWTVHNGTANVLKHLFWDRLPKVSAVHSPGLESNAFHALAKKQMSGGA